jgi:methionyl-tRNA formyltransferase
MLQPVKVALLCAGDIGCRCLQTAIDSTAAEIVAVFSYRVESPQSEYLDRIQELCRSHRIRFFESSNVGCAEIEQLWSTLDLDYLFAIKWRTMIPQRVVDSARHGLIVFHASLLPKYRGWAPVNWPLINGEEKTGVTMFYAADDVDAGDIIEQRERRITDEDDAGTIDAWLNANVEEMLKQNLPRLADGTAARTPQDHDQATYTIWRTPEDGRIDWRRSAREIWNLVRGLTRPYPGAFTILDGRKLIVWSAELETNPRRYVGSVPGKVERILPGLGVNVLTGDGTLRLKQVQFENDEPRNAAQVISRLKTKFE